MAFTQNFKVQTGIGRLLTSGLVVLSMLFIIFSISCQAPTTEPAPSTEPTPTVTEEEEAVGVSNEIKVSGFVFVPATVTVAVGTTVTWTNLDSAAHTVTSETDLFDSGNLIRNASFDYSFTDRGTFSYFCAIHPYMKGEVIVE